MELRSLGAGSLKVSKVSLGAMSFGGGFTRETKIDDDLASRLVNTALDAGVNLIDTAETYGGGLGRSEEVLSRVIKGRRDEVLLATKLGYANKGERALAYDAVIAACEASCLRLGVEVIDLYQLHRADRTVPLEETVAALEELVNRGLIREFGLSNHRAFEIAESVGRQRALGKPAFVSTQCYYALLCRDLEHEILPFCRTYNVGVLVNSALAGGLLAGFTPTPGAAGREKFGGFPPIIDDDVLAATRVALDAIATGRGVSMAQVAMAWTMAQPGVTSVIAGPSKVEQLEDNIAAAELKLTDEELTLLDNVAPPKPIYPEWTDERHGFTKPAEATAD